MILTTQFHLLGVYHEIEVYFTVEPCDPGSGTPETVELQEITLLGFYPEGCDSPSVRRNDYVYLGARADLNYLTLEEVNTLEDACYAHLKKLEEEAWDV